MKGEVVRFSLSSGTSPVLNTLTSMVARNQVRRGILLFPLSLWVWLKDGVFPVESEPVKVNN